MVLAVVPLRLAAHEGHAHKAMGTVAAVDGSHLEIAGTDGKKITVLLTPETKYLKGKTRAAAADVQVGQRVAVTFVDDGGRKKATEVRLAAAAKPGAPDVKASPRP
jgi:hypothetical protein